MKNYFVLISLYKLIKSSAPSKILWVFWNDIKLYTNNAINIRTGYIAADYIKSN